MLQYSRDWQTLTYLTALPLLAAALWMAPAFDVLGYTLLLALSFATPVMAHNHAHVPLWRSRVLNRVSDLWFALLLGHPGFMFEEAHIDNHHRHRGGPLDRTRTSRFGEDNTLGGFLLHPLRYVAVMAPWSLDHLASEAQHRPWRLAWIAAQYAAVLGMLATLAMVDPVKTFVYALAPQAFALFFLFASNYLQHAEADHRSDYDHSRNFVGVINTLYFNIGLHTAHHNEPRLHWSELAAAHERISSSISPRMIETSFWRYCVRTWIVRPLRAPQ
jgi:beta-carotene hydroxylase